MKFITVSELRAGASRIVSEIEETRDPVTVTKNGKPVVVIQYLPEGAFAGMDEEALVLRLGELIEKAGKKRGEGKGGKHGKKG